MTVLSATFGRTPFTRQLSASAEMQPLVDALIRAHWAYEGWGEPPVEQMDVLRRAAMRTAETAVGMMSVRHQCALQAACAVAAERIPHTADERDELNQTAFEIVDSYLCTVRSL